MGGPAAFDPLALDANRAGLLSDEQRSRLHAESLRSRGWSLLFSVVSAAMGGALVLATASQPAAGTIVGGAFLLVAGWLLVAGAAGTDALSRDLRAPHLDAVEGAISKRRSSNLRTTVYLLELGGMSLPATPGQFDAAPAAGWARVFYLRGSRRVVNLEQLAAAGIPNDALQSPGDFGRAVGTALRSGGQTERAEAIAQLQAMTDAMNVNEAEHGSSSPPGEPDPRPLIDAIAGRWTNGMFTIEFRPDGTAVADFPDGRSQTSHWSTDGNRKLVADFMGVREAADAWVTSEGLTIVGRGQTMKLTRAG